MTSRRIWSIFALAASLLAGCGTVLPPEERTSSALFTRDESLSLALPRAGGRVSKEGPNGEGISAGDQAGAPGGHMVLVGGGRKPPVVVDLFVKLAGGPRARIVVLPLASGESRQAGEDYIDLFEKYGVKEIRVIHIDDRRDALRREFAEAIRSATGVFFSGGDQSRVAARILDTPILDALREMKQKGGVIGGTSAGTACQSEVMMTGFGNERVLRYHNIVTARGLGLVDWGIMDTHFRRRHRETRISNVVLEHPNLLGVGVDEATAAWIKPNGTLEVLGEGKVLVFDGFEARVSEGADGNLKVDGLKVHELGAGQKYDYRKRQVIQP